MPKKLALLLVSLAWASLAAQAAVKIEPLSMQLSLEAGRERQEQFLLINDTDQAIELSVEPEYWHQGGCRQPLEQWIHFSPGSLKVPAQGRQYLRMKIKVPEQLDGECMVMIYLASKPMGTKLKICPRIGVPVYLRRQGPKILKGRITVFKPMPRQEAFGGTEFVIELQNEGNVHLVPFGIIDLKGRNINQAYQHSFKFREPVFAGQRHGMEIRFAKEINIPAGVYKAEVKLFLDNLYDREDQAADLIVLTQKCQVSIK